MLIVPAKVLDDMKSVKHKILAKIKSDIGDQKIDLLMCDPSAIESDPFVQLIYPSSKLIKEWK